ncbi:MAG TPA: cysteine synthase family protein [Patescibacteria group bacterium]|nr:cysteine synthase family protein [Patescibacteria group bacterium]
MNHADSIIDLIGSTPVLKYPLKECSSTLYLKLERFNPTLSYKDRMALNMVEDAERTGKLARHGTIIESSSGNTASALAMVAAAKGYKFIAIVDDQCSQEKIDTVKSFGGSIVKIKSKGGVPATGERRKAARQLEQELPGSYWTCQADNSANPGGYSSLASELIWQVPRMDTLIGSIGTGGSLCGTAQALRSHRKKVCVVAVEPEGSTIFSDNGHAYLQSGGGNPAGVALPKNIAKEHVNLPLQVSDAAAFTACNFMAKRLGLMVGGSAGGVVITALKYLSENPGSTTVAILADAGEKYVGTIFNEDWITQHHLHDEDTWDYLERNTSHEWSQNPLPHVHAQTV